jgi:hypothetical protein
MGIGEIAGVVFRMYPKRTFVGLSLFTGQAFLYNAIFFTYALVLTEIYGVPAGNVGWYLIPFAVGNFLGPLLLGRYFDTVGRKLRIAGTYILFGILLVLDDRARREEEQDRHRPRLHREDLADRQVGGARARGGEEER